MIRIIGGQVSENLFAFHRKEFFPFQIGQQGSLPGLLFSSRGMGLPDLCQKEV